MKAIVRQRFGGPEVLQMANVPRPVPAAGQVLVRVRAFGLNRAEQYFRTGAWGEVAAISGIECVGEVVEDASGRLAPGQSVVALMGGLGRSLPGSYAEFCCVPAANVVAVRSPLPWHALAALPESYATAWSCVHGNLGLQAGQWLVLRGAGSALGQAALNIAHQAGVRVIATVRSPRRIAQLQALGAQRVLVEDNPLHGQVQAQQPAGVDAVLDLVGNTTLLDSLQMLRRGGRVCVAGFLGGAQPIAQFDPLQQLPSGRQLSFFGSALVLGSNEFPLAEIPFQDFIDKAHAGIYRAQPAQVFGFDQIQGAHRLLDAQTATGKIVVRVD